MFFLQSRGPLQDGLSPVMGSSEESESPKNQRHLLRCKTPGIDKLREKKEATSGEFITKTVKAVTHVRGTGRAETRRSLGINYEPAAAEAINKVKQNLATKEIE